MFTEHCNIYCWVHCFLFCTLSTALLPLYSCKVKLLSSFHFCPRLFFHWVMLPGMPPVCPCACVCVCVSGWGPWGLCHMEDTSESSQFPEAPMKIQRSLCCWEFKKTASWRSFKPMFLWWTHCAGQEEITVKKSFSRTSCCEILSWLYPLTAPTVADTHIYDLALEP